LPVASVESSFPDSLRPLSGFWVVDTAGNVWEWCDDFYGAEYYSVSPADNPPGPGRTEFSRDEWNAVPPKVIRGGGYNASASEMRCANRSKLSGLYKRPYVGFRVARNL